MIQIRNTNTPIEKTPEYRSHSQTHGIDASVYLFCCEESSR
jgi:hypothetical protein